MYNVTRTDIQFLFHQLAVQKFNCSYLSARKIRNLYEILMAFPKKYVNSENIFALNAPDVNAKNSSFLTS